MCVVLFLQAATRCDSMTLTPGQWLGLPAVTAVTLYRHEDPALVGTDEEFSVFNSRLQPHSIISFFEEESFCCIFESFLRFPLFFFFPPSSQSLAAGLTSSQPVAKLRALPLWLSLQCLGHNGIVQKIKHATLLVCIF